MVDQNRPHARLMAWRLERGLSQRAAARVFRIRQGSWSFIERGERPPTLAQAFRLEKVTGIDACEWVKPSDLRVGRLAA